MSSRGVRNNNPGNIEDGSFARSQPGYSGSDGRFAKFDTMINGINAQVRLLTGYVSRGFDTISEIINRYAPSSENNTRSYISSVSRATGIAPNATLSMGQVSSVAAAMRDIESPGWRNMSNSLYDWLVGTPEQIENFRNRPNPATDIFGISQTMDDLETVDPTGILGWLRTIFSVEFAGRFIAVLIGIILIGVALVAFIMSNNNSVGDTIGKVIPQ